MKVSVIIPVYNVGKYLSKCLDSVISQNFGGELEIIAVNDGSTDNSAQILSEYADRSNCLKIIEQENRGQSAARNAALDVASGDLLLFVDADDELLPGAIKMLIEGLIGHKAEIAIGELATGKSPKKIQKNIYFKLASGEEATEISFYRKPYSYWGSVCGMCYKKSLFDDLRFKEGTIYEDLEIIPRLFHKAHNIAYTEVPVYFYRFNTESSINRWGDKRKEILNVIGDLSRLDYIGNNPILSRALKDREFNAAFHLYLLTKKHEPENREYLRLCRNIIQANRRQVIFNRQSRFKSRVASVESYFGMWLPAMLNKIFKFVK